MNASSDPTGRSAGPPSAVREKIRGRLSRRGMQGLEVVIAVRAAAQQIDYALNAWMANTAGSFARFQILMALWATAGKGIAHKEIVAAMRVTPATVSGLMAALEREGLVKSEADPDDRRKLIASLTAHGLVIVEQALEASSAGLQTAFDSFSQEELEELTASLRRLHDVFATTS
jgi:DNA-binding MarR family transcriptional regulator